MNWTQHRIIAFDTETTGLNPFDGDRVIEFGAVELTVDQDFRLTGVQAHDWLIDPEVPIPREVTKITGIKDEDVAGKPVFEQRARKIYRILKDSILIAHNLAFDLAFLKLEFARCDMVWPETIAEIDTLHISRAKLTEQRKHNLGHICHLFGVPLDNAHRASDDAEACGRVLLEFARRYNAPQDTEEMIIWADAVGPPPANRTHRYRWRRASCVSVRRPPRQADRPTCRPPRLDDHGPRAGGWAMEKALSTPTS